MFKLDISDEVQVPVKLALNLSGGATRQFAFTLTASRMTQAELEAIDREEKAADVLLERVSDWSGQRLVLGADGQPAPYSREAFDALLKGVISAPRAIFGAYIEACGAKAKN